uniref:Uncharacterized protein n=1 Tax=Peronospora matthiolae TaxID=2874970 RepID=A0AAV1TS25_9STRA
MVQKENPVSSPSAVWWVMCTAVQPLAELCNMAMVILQSRDMIIWQMNEIKNQIMYMMTTMNIETIQANEAYTPVLIADTRFHDRSKYWIRQRIVQEHISDQGSWARYLFNSERDYHNNVEDIAPPVLPQQLVMLWTGDTFAEVLDVFYHGHVGLYWNADDVDQIETDQSGLQKTYNHELTTKALIEGHYINKNFSVA